MDWADFYKDKYDKVQQEKSELLFILGFYSSALHQLKSMVEKGEIQASGYEMIKLKVIAGTVERANKESEEHFKKFENITKKSKACM